MLCFGMYAIICHLCIILLFYSISSSTLPRELLVRRTAAMLEYSAMSTVILLLGAFLLTLVKREQSNT